MMGGVGLGWPVAARGSDHLTLCLLACVGSVAVPSRIYRPFIYLRCN